MEIPDVPYVRNTDWMPDKNGAAVRVGDYVRLDKPFFGEDRDGETIAKVTSLHPRESYINGIPSNKNGILNTQHSHFGISVYRTSPEPWPNVEGEVASNCSCMSVEKLELDEERLRRRRADELQIKLLNINYRLTHFQGERLRTMAELQDLGVQVPA